MRRLNRISNERGEFPDENISCGTCKLRLGMEKGVVAGGRYFIFRNSLNRISDTQKLGDLKFVDVVAIVG